MKRWKIIILLTIVLSCVTGTTYAKSEVVATGTCGDTGDNLTWTITADGTLSISGTGAMKDYSSSPWKNYEIRKLVLSEGITSIGAHALQGCDLQGSLFMPEGITDIGSYAFYGCSGLTGIVSIPSSVQSIGEYAFIWRDSYWYEEHPLSGMVVFAGNMPAMAGAFHDDQTFYYQSGAKGWDNIDNPASTYESKRVSGTVQLDLAESSVKIFEGKDGETVYLQPDKSTVIYGTSNCVIVQKNSGSIATEHNIYASADCSIVLSNININTTDNAIRIENGVSATVTLIGENNIVVPSKDGSNAYAIYMNNNSNLTFEGTGSLSVTTGFSPAIYLKNSTSLTVNSGSLLLNNDIDATYGENSEITINSGDVTVNGSVYNLASIKLTGGNLNIENEYSCLRGNLYVSGGSLTAKATDSTSTTTIQGSEIVITGGTVSVIAGNRATAIDAPNGSISISNATVTATGYQSVIGTSKCDAITIDDSATMNLTHTAKDGFDYQEKITVNAQPNDSAALLNNHAKFTVDAYGHSGLSYQWQTSADGVSWVDVSGQNLAIGNVPVTSENNGYSVRCKITNGFGNFVYSAVVKVYQLAFSQQPADISMYIGGGVPALNVSSTCGNITYQWQRSIDGGSTWINVDGKIYSSLILDGTLNDNGLYRCVITATNGDILISNIATVSITDPDAPVTYRIIYYQQNADGATYTAYEQIIDSAVTGTSVSAPPKVYQHFIENSERGVSIGTVAKDGSLVLSRYYDRLTYTIAFEMNGGTAEADITTRYGTSVTAPPNPTRAGYVFDGWYADEALTEAFTFSTMPGENITVYAAWTAIGEGRGIEYEITGITLLDKGYNTISKIPNGSFYAEVSVKNLSSSTMDTLMLATYDENGRFLGLQYLRSNPPIGYTFVLGTTINNSSGDIASIKAFMVPTLGSIIPLAESKEFKA